VRLLEVCWKNSCKEPVNRDHKLFLLYNLLFVPFKYFILFLSVVLGDFPSQGKFCIEKFYPRVFLNAHFQKFVLKCIQSNVKESMECFKQFDFDITIHNQQIWIIFPLFQNSKPILCIYLPIHHFSSLEIFVWTRKKQNSEIFRIIYLPDNITLKGALKRILFKIIQQSQVSVKFSYRYGKVKIFSSTSHYKKLRVKNNSI